MIEWFTLGMQVAILIGAAFINYNVFRAQKSMQQANMAARQAMAVIAQYRMEIAWLVERVSMLERRQGVEGQIK
jgi:hypothetical protein